MILKVKWSKFQTSDLTSKVYTSEPNRSSSNYASHINSIKYSKLEANVSQTMGRDAQQATKHLRI